MWRKLRFQISKTDKGFETYFKWQRAEAMRQYDCLESATFSFNIKKAKCFSIAIAKTWDLTFDERLSREVLQRLQNDVYVSFKVLNCSVAHSFKNSHERYEIIDFLHHNAPTLNFKNGTKQQIASFLFRNMPHIYIQLRYLYGIIAEDVILPYCHHMLRRRK